MYAPTIEDTPVIKIKTYEDETAPICVFFCWIANFSFRFITNTRQVQPEKRDYPLHLL